MIRSEFAPHLLTLAKLLRTGYSVEVVTQLPKLCNDLKALWTEFDETERQQLVRCLKAILAAQQRQDWLALADELEFELMALLEPITPKE